MPDPAHLIYAGTIGVLLGILAAIHVVYRRIRSLLRTGAKDHTPRPGVLASLRTLFLIALWTSVSGIAGFAGAFLQSYRVFTHERPVADIRVQPLGRARDGPVSLLLFSTMPAGECRYLLLKGDQWRLEGDILKWDDRLLFLGLKNRYRLTRLTGRYIDANAERERPRSVFFLTRDEASPLWRSLYRIGNRLPFVSTVYGSAAYQDARPAKRYLVYVGSSGFLIRQAAGNGDSEFGMRGHVPSRLLEAAVSSTAAAAIPASIAKAWP